MSRQLLGGGVLILIFLSIWFVRRSNSVELLKVNGLAFSTLYEVKVVTSDVVEGADEALKTAIKRELDFVDKAMSRFREDSEIARFNAISNTESFEVSKETASLLKRSRDLSEMTGGAFDVTVGPLIKLWGFYTKQKKRAERPSEEEIEDAKSKVGYGKLELDMGRSSIRKAIPDLHVDLSAVAKGFAVDRIAVAIEALGYSDFMVEIGGEVRARGANNKSRIWRIGIEKPVANSRELFQIVELKDKSIATSGDYRNYYELNDKLVSHTVDPRTGQPVDHQLASVTVVHDECAMADALATALTVLGPENGYNLAKAKGIPALFITRVEGGTLVSRSTPGFEKMAISHASKGP